jgi:SAM-dependent methyltransferase
MDIHALAERLDYLGDPGLLRPGGPNCPPAIARQLRRAEETCGLRLAYSLREPDGRTAIPVVYLCEAQDDAAALRVHHRVWNQNLVPFLVVSTPERFVLYPGFQFDGTNNSEIGHVIKSASASLDAFRGLHAQEVCDGRIWERWGRHLNPAKRVDWSLLTELEQLGALLRDEHRLTVHQAHNLIGKYLYLHYLRDRRILSDAKLEEWGIAPSEVFGRKASASAFHAVTSRLEDWLNGSVFPLAPAGGSHWEAAIRRTAAILSGDGVRGQMHLDFPRYDFSQIPIETLSVIYQQFLHAEGAGREKGAYYTPTFLVDLILDEVDARRPLRPGTRILDPACGSGAFLVQGYRRLIEGCIAAGERPTPAALRKLLTDHVFGIDQDADACRVAAFSLSLTLLDYVDPPDLRRYPTFKLPALLGRNIHQGDFFAERLPFSQTSFDWVVGNPPWIELKPNKLLPDQRQAHAWMAERRKTHPVGGWQLAEAFLWKAAEHLTSAGAAGILAPAMTLFKGQSEGFRKAFFSRVAVWCVANFANLAYVLFSGRANVPAAAFFFMLESESEAPQEIFSYAPLLINQPALKRGAFRRQQEAWVLTANSSEIRRVDRSDAVGGRGDVWKMAMWGSRRSADLLHSVERRFPSFRQFAEDCSLVAHQGLELRTPHPDEAPKEKLIFADEVVEKPRLLMKVLERCGKIYRFPPESLGMVAKEDAYVRERGSLHPVRICRPPHLVVPRHRRWIVFDNNFLVIPHPQIGISGQIGQENLLKALALYLGSDFARFFEFFAAAEMGIQKTVADLDTLKGLPIPLLAAESAQLKRWALLYDELAGIPDAETNVLRAHDGARRVRLEQDANDMVFDALELSEQERWLVEDLIQSRLGLIKGKLGKDGVARPPDATALRLYADALGGALASYGGDEMGLRYHVEVWPGGDLGVAVVTPSSSEGTDLVAVKPASADLNKDLSALRARLRQSHGHWLYFERELIIYEQDRAMLVKPMQQLHWLRSQALQDADNLIAEALAVGAADSWH